MTGWLVDTSVWSRTHQSTVAARLSDLDGFLFTCLVVALERGVSARNVAEHDDLRSPRALAAFGWAPLTLQFEHRAQDLQRLLVRGGVHRAAKVSDLLIAVTAAEHDLTVLHYDSDFDLIAEVTGQPCEWVVPRGSMP